MADSAYDYALNLLSALAYTSRNLRRKLVGKAFAAADVEAAIARLEGNGLLDDEKYAVEYARQKLLRAGVSARRLEQELARKGIAPAVAKAAVSAVIENESVDTEALVMRIAKKKLVSMGDLDPTIKRRRLFGFLARRGYELDDIKRVVDRLFTGGREHGG